MSDQQPKSLDIIGIKPVADSCRIVTQGTVDGAAAFLRRICLPAAEEFGLLLKDKVSAWRAANAIVIAQKAEQILKNQGRTGVHAHPRLVHEAVEKGSWHEDDLLQGYWAGLLASSCSDTGDDDSNILFMSILDRLSRSQGQLIYHICTVSKKALSSAGWIGVTEALSLTIEQLTIVTGVSDVHRLDRELDHLRSMELIGGDFGTGGFRPESLDADVTPKPLTLHLFVRCQGFVGSPAEYWGLSGTDA